MGTDAGTGYTFATQPPPSHHVHKSSDVLPGARGTAGQQAAPDYSMDVTESSRVWQEPQDSAQHDRTTYGAGSDTRRGQHDSDYDAPTPTNTHTAPATGAGDRPLGVQPTEQGGVAIGGDSNLPEGHANMTDKIIGKTQKLTGKVTNNAGMHEKGELRESGGKAAAQGQARAPHD
ncbi:hypothetical protein C8Q74DRAFT_1211078 [Fomes fomentarius]|nr:hypothetical protein C8Q74DRAFT_1211078 [Fomes fomentarius]